MIQADDSSSSLRVVELFCQRCSCSTTICVIRYTHAWNSPVFSLGVCPWGLSCFWSNWLVFFLLNLSYSNPSTYFNQWSKALMKQFLKSSLKAHIHVFHSCLFHLSTVGILSSPLLCSPVFKTSQLIFFLLLQSGWNTFCAAFLFLAHDYASSGFYAIISARDFPVLYRTITL